MKKKIYIALGGLLAILMLFGAVTATTAYAQKDTPTAPTDQRPGGGRGLGQTELEAAAKALGMTADELSTALQSGKTLEDLATAAGVDIQDVQDAISAAHAVELRAQIEAGVADGSISQDKADWLLEGLDKGFLDGAGFGLKLGGRDGGRGPMPMNAEAIAAAADALGMTSDEVSAALEAGTTLEELATQAGVDYQTVKDAIHTAMPARTGGHGQPPAQATQTTNP
jgi:uncharacterized protein YidB (DUF937 family)